MDQKTKNLIVLLFPLLIASMTIGIYLHKYDGEVRVLIGMTTHFANCLENLPSGFPIFKDGGNDGSYNYAASRDPLFNYVSSLPECASSPTAYANERFLFQFLSWAASFGEEHFLPYSMTMVNLLSIFLISIFSMRHIEHLNGNPWLVLVCALNPGI